MTKKKWLSRHSDGQHFIAEYPDKDNLPRGSMKTLEPVDEAIDGEREITGEEYAQELYPEEYDETPEEQEGREIIEEIQEEKAEGDHSALGKKAEGRLKEIEERLTINALKGEDKANTLSEKLRREVRKMILKRQLKELEK